MPLLEKIIPVFRDIFDDPSLVIDENSNASTVVGWDSFAHINLIVSLEGEFGVSFSTKELGEMQCVGDLVKLLETKGVCD
jgi:acyl carrier protein